MGRVWWNWVEDSWGHKFIVFTKSLLAIILILDLIYTVLKIRKENSRSKFVYSLLPFIYLYAAFLFISLQANPLQIMASVVISAIIAL
jgi:hypothetical protein